MKISKSFYLFMFFILVTTNVFAGNEKDFFGIDQEIILKIGIPILSAILSAISTYFFTRRKEKTEQKELAYSILKENVTIKASKEIINNLKVNYKGTSTENMTFYTCNFQNTGEKPIHNQTIRFEFSKETNILEGFFNSIPEPELNAKYEQTDNPLQPKLTIGSLGIKQIVSFNFIVSGTQLDLKLHKSIDDVQFISKGEFDTKSDKTYLSEFIHMNLYLLILYPFVNFLPSGINFIAGTGYGIFIFAVNIPYIKRISSILSNLIFASRERKELKFDNMSITGGNVTFADTINS